MSQLFARSMFKLFFGLKIYGKENIPQEGPFILAANHQSWIDPPIAGSSCWREVFFAAKQELFKIPVLKTFIRLNNSIPVKRTGYDRRMLFLLGKALDAGYGVTIFPEGTRYLDGKLRPPKSGVGMLAAQHNVRIVPAYISGSANLKKQLIKRELSIKFGESFSIGDLIDPESKEKETYKLVSRFIMDKIALTGGVKAPDYNN